jgi:YVTN family beta-propeller protein
MTRARLGRAAVRPLGSAAFALALIWSAAGSVADEGPAAVQRFEKDGLTVEFVAHERDGQKRPVDLVPVDRDVMLRFAITGTTGAAPLSGLRPAVWIDPRTDGPSALTCQQKVQSFLQGSLAYRPRIDLNAWYVLALNATPSITVIDPLLQFGGQKIVTLVLLDSPGEDWVFSPDGKRLFVTLPASDKIAVVDTVAWKVVSHIEAGPQPKRILLQPDGKYLWAVTGAAEKAGGVSVIDSETHAVVGRLALGRGPHELAFTDDSRYAFASNAADGTVSTIDVRRLTKIGEVRTGPRPVSLAYSELARSLYVADETDGTIAAVDASSHEVKARIRSQPGLKTVRVSPDGRWVLATNSVRGEAVALDTAFNRIGHVLDVGPGADQIAFTSTFAYVRAVRDHTVGLVPWTKLGSGEAIPVQRISAGRSAHAHAAGSGIAQAMARPPGDRAMLIANRLDRTVYYYVEGMNAPMGSFNNYRDVKAVLAADRSLREAAGGVLEASVRLPEPGAYDVAFFLGSPRLVHCFTLTATGEPAIASSQRKTRLEFLVDQGTWRAGETAHVQFRLKDPVNGQPVEKIQDLVVLSMLVPGTSQRRGGAQPRGEGLYEASIPLPKPGIYYVHVQSASLKARFQDLPYLTLHALPPDAPVPDADLGRGGG